MSFEAFKPMIRLFFVVTLNWFWFNYVARTVCVGILSLVLRYLQIGGEVDFTVYTTVRMVFDVLVNLIWFLLFGLRLVWEFVELVVRRGRGNVNLFTTPLHIALAAIFLPDMCAATLVIRFLALVINAYQVDHADQRDLQALVGPALGLNHECGSRRGARTTPPPLLIRDSYAPVPSPTIFSTDLVLQALSPTPTATSPFPASPLSPRAIAELLRKSHFRADKTTKYRSPAGSTAILPPLSQAFRANVHFEAGPRTAFTDVSAREFAALKLSPKLVYSLVRIRPQTSEERSRRLETLAHTVRAGDITVCETRCSVRDPAGIRVERSFRLDHCVPEGCDNGRLSRLLTPLFQSALRQNDLCIIADGQSGAGKSHTMLRGPHALARAAANEVFGGQHRQATCSVAEVYMGNVFDLLAPNPGAAVKLRIGGGMASFTRRSVVSSDQFHEIFLRACRTRRTRRTTISPRSSRGHLICTMTILPTGPTSPLPPRGRTLTLVDLAGNERLGSGKVDPQFQRELISINKGRLALHRVLRALPKASLAGKTDLLTRCLHGTFENSILCFIAHVSPLEQHRRVSLETLKFAQTMHSEPKRSQTTPLTSGTTTPDTVVSDVFTLGASSLDTATDVTTLSNRTSHESLKEPKSIQNYT